MSFSLLLRFINHSKFSETSLQTGGYDIRVPMIMQFSSKSAQMELMRVSSLTFEPLNSQGSWQRENYVETEIVSRDGVLHVQETDTFLMMRNIEFMECVINTRCRFYLLMDSVNLGSVFVFIPTIAEEN